MNYYLYLVLFLLFISGCSSQVVEQLSDNSSDVEINDEEIGTKELLLDQLRIQEVESSNIIVDRYKYVVGGKEGFDSAYHYFSQLANTELEVVLYSDDKRIIGELITKEDCEAKANEEEYEILSKGEGPGFTLGKSFSEKNRDLCVYVEAMDNGEIAVRILATEITYKNT